MNTFYVYAYIRSKDSATAKAGTPYYIGKGKNNRMYDPHNVPIPADRRYIVVVEGSLTEIGAFALERRYIEWWGRKDIGTGILNNRTDGGDGISGAILGPRPSHIREKISRSNTGKQLSEEHKRKLSEAAARRIMPPVSAETRRKMSIAQTGKIKITNSLAGKTFDEIYGELADLQREKRKLSNIGKSKGPMSEEHKEKIRKATKGRIIIDVSCPYCNTVGGKSVMQRWHFDNCKDKDD